MNGQKEGGYQIASSWLMALASGVALSSSVQAADANSFPYKFNDPGLKVWLLPDAPPYPSENESTPERVSLGKMLFFDPRLSRTGEISCSTCHNPLLGWADGTPRGIGLFGQELGRSSPTVMNSGYNTIFMWDGRKPTLEEQAKGPLGSPVEMSASVPVMVDFLKSSPEYKEAFEKAYPGSGISLDTVASAIAAFERTLISNNSPFDRWVKGDKSAMTPQQVKGFELYVRPDKGNCAVCHAPPNFTDNGFHNIGVATPRHKAQDVGRFEHVPLKFLKGAFKTPGLRDIEYSSPYMHDGSEETLEEVVAFYARHGDDKSNLDPQMKKINLTDDEQKDVVSFMRALSSPRKPFQLPVLPVTQTAHERLPFLLP